MTEQSLAIGQFCDSVITEIIGPYTLLACVSHCDDVRGPAVESQAVIGQFQTAGVAQRSAAVTQEVRSVFGAQPHLNINTQPSGLPVSVSLSHQNLFYLSNSSEPCCINKVLDSLLNTK